MIKKFLLSLFVGLIIIGGSIFVNAETIGNELPYGFYMDSIYNTIDKNLNFENSEDGNWLYRQYSNGAKRTILWNNGKLYTYFYENQNSNYQGFFSKACKVYSETGLIDFQGSICTEFTEDILNEFYNLTNYNFTYVITPNFSDRNYYAPVICFYNDNNKYYYCMSLQYHDGGNLEIPNNTIDFINYSENSPFSGGNNNYNPGEIENITGDVELVKGSIDSYINYYETRYNWDEGLCYVGTDDLTSAYGKSGVNFEYGSGATIFELYNTMYGTFGSNIISNVGSFINCWFINYNQWFYTVQDERSYKCIYNGPDTNITLDYEDLTFPFRNNRIAIYFMIDNLFYSMPEQSMGEHFAYYCMMKLNYDNYKNGSLNFQDLQDKVNPKILDRIDDYNNTRLPNYQGFSVPDMSGNTNIWGNLIQTGSGIPQDLNPTDLFKQFYNKINSLLQNFNPARAVGIIPLWILYPMLFLILFRILRH